MSTPTPPSPEQPKPPVSIIGDLRPKTLEIPTPDLDNVINGEMGKGEI